MEVHIHIGFETLKVKCTRYGICSQATFKNARAMFFFVFGRGRQLFSGGFEKIPGGGRNFAGGLPPPGSDIPYRLVRVFIVTRSQVASSHLPTPFVFIFWLLQSKLLLTISDDMDGFQLHFWVSPQASTQ
jgi:hypothetical protein